jgi:hypothetical protein
MRRYLGIYETKEAGNESTFGASDCAPLAAPAGPGNLPPLPYFPIMPPPSCEPTGPPSSVFCVRRPLAIVFGSDAATWNAKAEGVVA